MLDFLVHRHHSRQAGRRALFRWVYAAVVALVAWPAVAAASPREWQPMVIGGGTLRSLNGARIDRLEMLAVHAGKIQPIPFQVDERASDGSYLLPNGPQAMHDDRQTFSADDEIALMISDLGERAPTGSQLVPGAIEIQVHDPLGGPDRYCYIAAVDSPRLSAQSYVSFDPQKEVLESDHFRIGFTGGLPSDFATQNRPGENPPNLIDRMKVRLSTKVFHLVPFSFSEDDIHSTVLAWKAGPIRVLRRLSHSVNLILGLDSPAFERDDVFYRDCLESLFRMGLPVAPRIFFSDIRVRIDLDFNDLDGYELLWSRMAMAPVKIGDREMERRIDERGSVPISWIGIRGGGRMTVEALAGSPELLLLDRRLYFNDNPGRADPPEHVPGEHPGIGYSITGWEKLGAGDHIFGSLLITTAKDYSPDVLLEELRTPPVATTRPLANAR